MRHIAYDGMPLLQDFVHGNERLEGLDLIGQDGLNPKSAPERY
jgi:hypothetical protein